MSLYTIIHTYAVLITLSVLYPTSKDLNTTVDDLTSVIKRISTGESSLFRDKQTCNYRLKSWSIE